MYKRINCNCNLYNLCFYNYIKFYFNTNSNKPDPQDEKKKKINKSKSSIFKPIKTTNSKPYDPLKNNLYLQIFSCLDKLNALDTDIGNVKVNEILEKHKTEINENEILNLLELKGHDPSSDLKNKEEILSYVEKLTNEEISEEEYSEDKSIRFLRPPHNVKELKKVFETSEKIYSENKIHLFKNDSETKKQIHENISKKIPNYLILRNLQFPLTNTEITVVGVHRTSDTHSLFVSNLLSDVNPDLIAVHMQPDLPIFLNSDGNYNKDWKAFVTRKSNYEFLVNPLPHSVSEIILSKTKIEKIFDETFTFNDEISISEKLVYNKQRAISVRSVSNSYADAFLTPFLHSYSSRTDNFCPVAICDYPLLKKTEDIVFSNSIDDLKQVFQKTLEEMRLNNYMFSYEAFSRKIFLNHRMDYTAEVLRQLSYSFKSIILVIDSNYVDVLISSWKGINSHIRSLSSLYEQIKTQDMNFIEYLEKLVIVDILQGSFINDKFIKFNTFPFQFRPYDSWKTSWISLFQIWEHFYKHYSSLMAELPFNSERYNDILKKINVGIEKEDMEDEEDEKKEMMDEII